MTTPRSELAIGIFDSGVGGLTVLRALRAALPRERLIYLGDTARVPYGNKAPETVLRYSMSCAEHLIQRGLKLLIIACNTATAIAGETLATTHDIPVIGVIEPAAALAVAETHSGVIGVLGTRATVSSQAYLHAITRRSPHVQVVQHPCPLLVPLAEEGWCDGPIVESIVERYLAPLAGFNLDTLILGCTHYPLLRGPLQRVAQRILNPNITIIDSAMATAQLARTTLHKASLLRDADPPPITCLVTDAPEHFTTQGERFLGQAFHHVEHIDLKL